MNKVVVTGAGGFVGSAVTRKLIEQGIEVITVTRTQPLPDNVRGVDVFFHFAHIGEPFGKSFKDVHLQIENIANDCTAVTQAIKCGASRFVYAQTSNIFEIREFLKSNIPNPRWTNVYAGAKTAAEILGKTMAFNNDIEYISGAPTLIYGPGNHHIESFSDVLIRKLINGEDIDLIEGNNPYDWVYIEDVADAFCAIAEHGTNLKTYYIGHRKIRTFREIVCEISGIVNPLCSLNFGKYPEPPQIINWNEVGLDDLYCDTGWEAKADFRESILKTVEWMKEAL